MIVVVVVVTVVVVVGGGGSGVVVWCSGGIKSQEIFRLVLQGINTHISASHS
jgi:hypothetical protein